MIHSAGYRQKGTSARPPTAPTVERRCLPRSHVDCGQRARDVRSQTARSMSDAKNQRGEETLTPRGGSGRRLPSRKPAGSGVGHDFHEPSGMKPGRTSLY